MPIGKAHPFLCQQVNARSTKQALISSIAIQASIAKVIHQYKDDIWFVYLGTELSNKREQ